MRAGVVVTAPRPRASEAITPRPSPALHWLPMDSGQERSPSLQEELAAATKARQRVEGALRDSENRARVLLEAASEGVIVVDAAGRIVSVNGRTAQMFGYGREELIGAPLEILVPARLRERHVHHRHAFFAEPRVRPMGRGLDLAGCRKDGSEFPVEISLSYVQTEDGVQALGFVSDITERLAAERAARQADRLAAIGRLAAGVAHEVNNPIGIIASRIELMLLEAQDNGLPPAVVADLEVLHRHATRIAAIAQKLLSFARESPREHTRIDLNAIVREALLLFQRDPGHEAVQIHTALAEPLPAVVGDSGALQQVVLNIVQNSRQAIGERGEIAVTTLHEAGQVRVVVRDTGPGIAPDVLPKIFDPFFTTKADGTGLGLSITYGIVRDHHGTVDVESRPGAGTTFTLSFPVAVEPARA
ncbi:MAG: PAS domain S-box protein [Candidatus Rokuibacteriota bacterium]|nr:MAG: PAS domain S-box protein [Candidatus Rokubacteria bacterium]